MSILQVQRPYARFVFEQQLDGYLTGLRNEAITWFELAYAPPGGPAGPDERDAALKRASPAVAAFVHDFQKIPVEVHPVPCCMAHEK